MWIEVLRCVDRVVSRSDKVMVAVGFSPRWKIGCIRVAERRMNHPAAFNCRYATRDLLSASIRGLKPTATFASSLREGVN